ncbi:hypothetical protein [Nocardia sp. NBC_01009]|uniref:hypothetical protein n=1 Tax=Nocardia sp. NBC_01009 TaxID=2975996 RepID=UPI003866A494|nr:hypothetical protein OHA42_00240 [Nocardia sp. NBC_01009]
MTNTFAEGAEYTMPTQRLRRNPPSPDRVPVFGNDMQLRTALIPDRIRAAPINHDYELLAVQDAQNAGYLREIQDLAAELARVAAFAAVRGHNQTDQLRVRQLESALDATMTDAAAAGIAASDIQLAVEQGRAGAYWIDRPAHRYLGRIAQLTDEMAGRLSELDTYRQRIAELEHRLAQARDNA